MFIGIDVGSNLLYKNAKGKVVKVDDEIYFDIVADRSIEGVDVMDITWPKMVIYKRIDLV